MTNPFSPPNSHVQDIGTERGSPIKAVVLALLVDFGGTTFSGVLLAMAYGAFLGVSGATPEQSAAALGNFAPGSWLFLAATAIGTFFSGLGGYVCARIAKHNEYKLGAIVAAISTAMGLAIGATEYSLVMNVAMAIVAIGAIMLGVRFGLARNGEA